MCLCRFGLVFYFFSVPQVLEKFFSLKVASAPYKPNAMTAFHQILRFPHRILKDCVKIMQLELVSFFFRDFIFKKTFLFFFWVSSFLKKLFLKNFFFEKLYLDVANQIRDSSVNKNIFCQY